MRVEKPVGLFGTRHTQYFLMFASTCIAYGMRTILNVAIVAMVGDEDDEAHDYPTYPEWQSRKNMMLSSFFWGYICLQVGAGQLAKKYGPKLFLLGAILTASLFTILIPFFGKWFGFGGVIASRIIQGFCQGFLLPSIHNLLSLWTHISERARWGAIVYAGQALGNVFAMPITGIICDSSLGWPLVFYLYGGIGIVWCILWGIFGSDSPAKHKNISPQEKAWLRADAPGSEEEERGATPWRAIFTSLPFISIIIAHVGQNWGFWTLLTEIPSYMNNALDFKLTKNSLISALPYFVMWALNLVMGPIADFVIEKKIVSLTVSRKIFNSIGFFIPALSLMLLGCIGSSNKTLVIALLVVGVGFNAGQYSGFNVNHIDLSPVHAGTLMAITNSSATVASILAPLAVDIVASFSGFNEQDEQLWNIVFFVAAGIYLVAGIWFILFASGELQHWNSTESDPTIKQPDRTEVKILRKLSVSVTA